MYWAVQISARLQQRRVPLSAGLAARLTSSAPEASPAPGGKPGGNADSRAFVVRNTCLTLSATPPRYLLQALWQAVLAVLCAQALACRPPSPPTPPAGSADN